MYILGILLNRNLKFFIFKANLENSNMTAVNLRVATLRSANLKNCDLRSAVLAGADLEVRCNENCIKNNNNFPIKMIAILQ